MSFLRTRDRIALSAFLLSFLILTPCHAKKETASKTSPLMPAAYGSVPAFAELKEADLYQKGVKVGKEKDGKRYYEDGRLALEREGQVVSVYHYQDEVGGHMVYRKDHANRSYLIEQYLAGVRNASLDSNGVYQVYNTDGTVQQKIDPADFTAYYYDYETRQITETDAEGNSYPIIVLTGKTAYVNTADGKSVYSTSTYTRENGSVTESVVYAATGREEVYKDGVLVSTRMPDGSSTDYTYKHNKKGEVVKRIETSSTGSVRTVNVRKETPKAPAVNFGKVQRAVLASAKDPSSKVTVKTNNGNIYELMSGGLNTFTLTTKNATYYFQNGVLLSTVAQDGRTIVRVRDAEYIRI